MRLAPIASLSALAVSAAAAPYGPYPLSDGFPEPSPAQLAEIETLAGGSLPNGPLPTQLSPTAIVTLQLIALNEIFEVAYFTDLLANITTNVTGYELDGYNRTFVIEALTAVVNVSVFFSFNAWLECPPTSKIAGGEDGELIKDPNLNWTSLSSAPLLSQHISPYKQPANSPQTVTIPHQTLTPADPP